MVELLSEPLYILATVQKRYSLRVGLESTAQLVKGVVVAVLLSGLHDAESSQTAMLFSWGQLAYAGVLFIGFCLAFIAQESRSGWWARASADKNKLSPIGSHQSVRGGALSSAIDGTGLRLSFLFGVQAVGKFFLAEGSKLVLAAVQSDYDQGIVGLVTNLGSVIVRMVFQPVEEAAFLAFSAMSKEDELQSNQVSEREDEVDDRHMKIVPTSGINGRVSSDTPVAAAKHPLHKLLPPVARSVLTVSCVAAAFAPGFGYPFVYLAYGGSWAASPAPAALAVFGLSLPLLATNGVLEACVHGVADRGQLAGVNRALGITSALHLVALLVTTRVLGPLGLLLADALNMALRVTYCLWFLRREHDVSWRNLLPRKRTLQSLALVGIACAVSRAVLLPESALVWRWCGNGVHSVAGFGAVPFATRMMIHIGFGMVCLAGVTKTLWTQERDALQQLRSMPKHRQAKRD